jgi:hypothetical protein
MMNKELYSKIGSPWLHRVPGLDTRCHLTTWNTMEVPVIGRLKIRMGRRLKEKCCGAEQDLEVKSYLKSKPYKGRH